jgi:ribulose-phosphate 3-epimerase
MSFPVKVSPSILSADYGNIGAEARQAAEAGGSALHVDIMDGHYCHNFAFGIHAVTALKKYVDIPIVAHLEIDNPDAFIEDFAKAGSDMIVVQEDTCPHLPHTIETIKRLGVQAGIGINPDRSWKRIEVNLGILREIDLLIVLSVFPGFGGQPFSPVAIPRLQQAVSLRDRAGAHYDIGVDGSVNSKTIPQIVRAGGNYLIAGSSVFKGNIAENVKTLKKLGEDTMSKTIV